MSAVDSFLDSIQNYTFFEPIDDLNASLFDFFIHENQENAFKRSCLSGHMTASAVVVNQSFDALLLMHHKKLDIWLQFGGHADGNMHMLEVARTELEEESGITQAQLHSKNIFDLEIHGIPERKGEPEHLHFDVRFLFVVPHDISFEVNKDEAHDIRWYALDKIHNLERCWLDRVVRKVHAVRSKRYFV